MIVECKKCLARFEDCYRSTICPHKAFPANDGNNVFVVHEDAHLSHPVNTGGDMYDESYFLRGKQTGKSLYEDYRWMPELTVPMVCAMVSHLQIDPDDTILDFGCARGYVVKALRENGYNAYGHDVSSWAIDNCDPSVKEYLWSVNSWRYIGSRICYDWIIAKDVLEHIRDLEITVDVLKCARKGIFAVVPLAHGKEYDVPEYEQDITHIHRRPLQWWVSHFHQPGWTVTAQYRVPGIKDNYSQFPTGNGFITARRL